MSIEQKKANQAAQKLLNKSLLGAKPTIITGISATAIDAYAIQFVTESTFTALVGNYTGTATGVTYPSGLVIYGQFSSVTLGAADDTIIAYSN